MSKSRTKIYTLCDARREKHDAEMAREHRAAVREARAKVSHWKQRVAQFGGEVQQRTLAKFEAQLASLGG